jgi:hypothetical protein
MRNVRFHPEPPSTAGTPGGRGRFNVLLTEERWHGPDHWSRQLPRLMEPLGVISYKVRCGEEAWDVAQQVPIHAAVVDLATPRVAPPRPGLVEHEDEVEVESSPAANAVPGGLWLLELFRRLPNSPPVVIVRSRTVTPHEVNRLLREALHRGAFTVIEDPRLEQLLTVFQRMLDRLYHGLWPEVPSASHRDDQDDKPARKR